MATQKKPAGATDTPAATDPVDVQALLERVARLEQCVDDLAQAIQHAQPRDARLGLLVDQVRERVKGGK